MKDIYYTFYETVGAKYPEDDITYATISGLLRKKWITGTLQSFASGILLDCGCNVGRLSSGWRRGQIIGIDISYAVLHRGTQLFPKTDFIQGDLRAMRFIRDRTIDNAIACEVVEHLDAPDCFLKDLYRVLKPGSRALITVPGYTHDPVCCIELGIMRSYGITTGTHGDRYLHHAYSHDELAALVQQAGFHILASGSFEIELRLWQKPLTILENIFYVISSRVFPRSRLNRLFQRSLDRLKINVFFVLDMFGLSWLLKKMFKQGRRLYMIITK